MQNSARCVLPVTSTSRLRKTRSTSHGGHSPCARLGHLRERDLELVQRCRGAPRRCAAPGWSGRRTGPRTGTRATGGCASSRPGCAADRAGAGTGCRPASAPPSDDVVAAAGAGVAAVEHELLGAEPRCARLLVERRSCSSTSSPQLARRVDVDLDHAGIGRDLERSRAADRTAAGSPRAAPAAPSARRSSSIARDERRGSPRAASSGGRKTCSRAVARLDAQRGAHDPRRRLARAAARPRGSAARAAAPCRREHGCRCSARARGSGARGSNGIALGELHGVSLGATHGSESSGSRKPIGESPGHQVHALAAQRTSGRSASAAVAVRATRAQRQHVADRRRRGRCSKTRAQPRALLGVVELATSNGSTFTGSRRSRHR